MLQYCCEKLFTSWHRGIDLTSLGESNIIGPLEFVPKEVSP
jgi:hypothetical protein